MTNRSVNCASIDSQPRHLLSKQLFLWLWVLLNALLAALGGGTLAFGILELSPLLIALVALGFALAVGALWTWALRSPAWTRAWRAHPDIPSRSWLDQPGATARGGAGSRQNR